MPEPVSSSDQFRSLLARVRAGDEAARDRLMEYFGERLRRLTRSQLRQWPVVHRWEMTDDVAQNVAIRICRTLATVDVPSEQDLVRLASQHILWELQSLHARHTGPQGFAGNHATDPAPKDGVPPRHAAAASREASPHGVAFYQELQTLVGSLPEEERVVFDRLHFLGWTHQEVADDLGLSVETTKRRFRRAKLRLAERLGPDG